MSDHEPEVGSLYGWYRPRPRKPAAAADSPRHLAYLARLRARNAACDAADEGLACCPACGGVERVRLIRGAAGPFASSRLQRAVCPCGRKGPVVYGAEGARRAWNAPEWRAGAT